MIGNKLANAMRPKPSSKGLRPGIEEASPIWGVLEGILLLMHRIDRDAQNRPLK